MSTKIPVTVLCGYLGSGKTKLLNYLLHSDHGYRIAVIVNDMSEVNIDAELVKQGGFSRAEEELVQMQNGCICCTLRGDLLKEVDRLSKLNTIDYILIEASGISEPVPIAMTFVYNDENQGIDLTEKTRLDTMVTVVDAHRFWTDFGTGDDILARQQVENLEEEDIMDLIIAQIEFCDVVLLNKCDLLTDEQIKQVEIVIRTLQPEAKLLKSVKGVVPLSEILNTRRFNFEKAYNSAGWIKELNTEYHTPETEEYGISSFVYDTVRPFHPQRIYDMLTEDFPDSIIRAKGFMWLPNYNDDAILMEQAGKNIEIYPMAYWAATLPEDELEGYLKDEPQIARNWDKQYGDRRNQLVFIGLQIDKEKVVQDLNRCLLTEEEMQLDWQSFPDPFNWAYVEE
jgi:G3E family GTPase